MPKPPVLRPLRHRRPRGVSMIEVMVSLLVLSAGLAVIGAMQTRAVFNSSDAALQGYAAQILSSFSEAKLVEPNVTAAASSWALDCNGVYRNTEGSDQTYFGNLLAASCTTSRVVKAHPGATVRRCNAPFKSSINVYCKSSRTEIDFRQPVWAH